MPLYLNFQRTFLFLPKNLGKIIFQSLSRNEMVELTGIEPATSGVQNRRSPS
jgi:hypothetical protein